MLHSQDIEKGFGTEKAFILNSTEQFLPSLRQDCRKRGSKRYKGTATTISLWTNQPRVRPKATSTRRLQRQSTRTITPQDTRTYIHKKDIILLHPAGIITTFAIRKQGDFKEEPTSTRDIGLGLQLLLLHKTTCIVNERKTRSFCASTRLQTINASCEANQPSTS